MSPSGASERDLASPAPEQVIPRQEHRPPAARVGDHPSTPAEAIGGSAEAALLRGAAAGNGTHTDAEGRLADHEPGTPIPLLERVEGDATVTAFLELADEFMAAQGYTEHGLRHAGLVARIAHNVLKHLGADASLCELAAVGGYLHDVGNVVSRQNHGMSSAWIAYDALRRLDVDPYRVGIVMGAVGNHEEQYGMSVGPIAAAVILADKADVHRSRVREKADPASDIHDRVNHAVTRSFLRVDAEAATITLELEIDTTSSGLLEYWEIFLERMIMCRRAARTLGCEFGIVANDTPIG